MLVPLAVLAAGCGTSAARESSSGDASRIDVVARSKPTTRIVGGTPVQRAVLRRILSSLGPTGVRSVEVADSDPDGVVFKARANGSDDRFALWEASVVGNVFARRSIELHLRRVVFIEDDEGGEATYGPDLSAALTKTPLTLPEARGELLRVVEIAKEQGASARVRLLQPDRPAFVIELRTSDPARFLRDGLDPTLAPVRAEDWQRHDGLYVKVTDSRGEIVLESGAGLSVRADLSGCAHYVTGADGSGMLERPPCPTR